MNTSGDLDNPLCLWETSPTEKARFWMILATLFEQESKGDDEKVKAMISAMAKMGAPREVLVAMLEFGVSTKLEKDHKRFLLGPIIQQKSQWAETTPKWMYEAIGYDRLQLIFDERKAGHVGITVGPIELSTVIYPATMDSPIAREYADIYLWAAAKANAYHYNLPEEEIWKRVGGHQVKDDDILTPGGRYHYDYKNLCHDIRTKVVKRSAALKSQAQRDNIQEENSNPESPIQGIQLNLF